MSEERDDIIVLVDESGEETEFELLDSIEIDGNDYVVLLPLDQYDESDEEDDEEEGEDEVIILKVEHGNDGEDTFVNIDDEDVLNSVFDEFKSRMEDEYDFDED